MIEQKSHPNLDCDITIGYWQLRGRIQPTRLILEYLQIPYKDILYQTPGSWFTRRNNNLQLSGWTFK